MYRSRWIVVMGAVVIGLIAVGVSLLLGGGWGLILLEAAGVGLAIVLFLRGQREEEGLETGDQ